MSITLIELFIILFVHWIADFVFQTHEQATKKCYDNYELLGHTSTYASTWLGVGLIFSLIGSSGLMTLFGIIFTLLFVIITFVLHTVTDYYTSKWTNRLYKNEDYHNFFVVIGFDQLLHYAQLILTYKILDHYL